jgi:Holliday junction resolvase RusA-like endonuclease
MTSSITIQIPGLPNRNVGPNVRHFYKKKNKYFQDEKLRFQDYLVAHQCQFDPLKESVEIEFQFYPADKRRRDLDNLLSTTKPWIDGLIGFVIPDDSCQYLRSITGRYEDRVSGLAYTVIIISWKD